MATVDRADAVYEVIGVGVFEQEAEGILAVCIQHEVDHLNGKLFVDYLSALKRQRIKSKLEKEHRQQKTPTLA